MASPALPAYLAQRDLTAASPGLRFGLYLRLWMSRPDQEAEVNKRASAKSAEGQEVADQLAAKGMDATIESLRNARPNPLPGLWEKDKYAMEKARRDVTDLTRSDRERMRALATRQCALRAQWPDGAALSLGARAVAPFTTGLGNDHPLENGFAFLNPHGLPYLPASGVKGVVRQAARELAAGTWGDTGGWSDERRYTVRPDDETRLSLSPIEVLFGRDPAAGGQDHFAGTLSFWDVVPQIAGRSLLVEIMTPHQSHYYQQGEPPHESGQPTPIPFLTVPPASTFGFHVVCDRKRLERIAPELAADGHWRTLVTAAFEHAFEWLGFGAKTAVGYGAMERDDAVLSEQQPDEPAAGTSTATASASREERQIEALRQRLAQDREAGRKEPQGVLAEQRTDLLRAAQAWTDPDLRRRAADAIEETTQWLPWSRKKRKQRAEEVARLREPPDGGAS